MVEQRFMNPMMEHCTPRERLRLRVCAFPFEKHAQQALEFQRTGKMTTHEASDWLCDMVNHHFMKAYSEEPDA